MTYFPYFPENEIHIRSDQFGTIQQNRDSFYSY